MIMQMDVTIYNNNNNNNNICEKHPKKSIEIYINHNNDYCTFMELKYFPTKLKVKLKC